MHRKMLPLLQGAGHWGCCMPLGYRSPGTWGNCRGSANGHRPGPVRSCGGATSKFWWLLEWEAKGIQCSLWPQREHTESCCSCWYNTGQQPQSPRRVQMRHRGQVNREGGVFILGGGEGSGKASVLTLQTSWDEIVSSNGGT